jgi:hypothetical protein
MPGEVAEADSAAAVAFIAPAAFAAEVFAQQGFGAVPFIAPAFAAGASALRRWLEAQG